MARSTRFGVNWKSWLRMSRLVRLLPPAMWRRCAGTEPGASVFDLTLAIGEENRGRALAILARNLEAGEAPLRILGSLAWQYRRLWKVKEVVRQGGREGEAARTLRMDSYKVKHLDQFPDNHLHQALQLFLDADAS